MSDKYLRPAGEFLWEIIGVLELRDPGSICEGCYFRVLKAKDDNICPVCGETQRKKRQWHKDIRKYEP
jgi:rRNA maturation endonuclease Nob1